MKVICFSGNLGNQVFYCAFKDYLQTNYPNEDIYRYVFKGCPKVTVDKYFNLTLPKSSVWVNVISFFVFYLEIILIKLFNIKLPSSIVCGKGHIEEHSSFFSNYLQDKYFYEKRDSTWLQIKMPIVLSEDYKYFEEQILNTNSICIHIRRGDYIHPDSAYVDLSATDYYHKAIKQAKEKYPDGKLFFFSDDMEFVKRHFDYDNSVYVDCNRGAQSYLDIKLMSLAKVNIMANSTFSYWGAYINHEQKTVIYPRSWFCEWTGRTLPDIMLDNWIGI